MTLYTFDQADGNASGWTNPGAANTLYVKNNMVSTNNSTAQYGGYVATPIDTSGDWRIDIEVVTTVNTTEGGLNVWLIDGTGYGYGFFVGNAMHIQRVDPPGVQTNLSNDAVPGEGTGIFLPSWMSMTRRASDGYMETFRNGVHMGNATDTTYSGPYGLLLVLAYSSSSPTLETTANNLLVSAALTPEIAYPPFIRQNRAVPRAGVQRARGW